MSKAPNLIMALMLSVIFLFANSAWADLNVTDYTLISSKRVSRVEYEYTYRAQVTNDGQDAKNVMAQVTSSSPYTTVIEGVLEFGDVVSGAVVDSADTFVIKHNRRYPLDWSALTWDAQGGEAVGIVGAAGGAVSIIEPENPLFGLQLNVPTNALTEEKILTISPSLKETTPPDLPDVKDSFIAISLEPSGTIFNKFVSITIPYPDSDNDGIVDGTSFLEENLFVYITSQINPTSREALPIDFQDITNNYIVVKTNHFSTIEVSGSYILDYEKYPCGVPDNATFFEEKIDAPSCVDKFRLFAYFNLAEKALEYQRKLLEYDLENTEINDKVWNDFFNLGMDFGELLTIPVVPDEELDALLATQVSKLITSTMGEFLPAESIELMTPLITCIVVQTVKGLPPTECKEEAIVWAVNVANILKNTLEIGQVQLKLNNIEISKSYLRDYYSYGRFDKTDEPEEEISTQEINMAEGVGYYDEFNCSGIFCPDYTISDGHKEIIYYVRIKENYSYCDTDSYSCTSDRKYSSLSVLNIVDLVLNAIDEYQLDYETDGDAVRSAYDNCPNDPNPDQLDSDEDDVGDACDSCSATPTDEIANSQGCSISQLYVKYLEPSNAEEINTNQYTLKWAPIDHINESSFRYYITIKKDAEPDDETIFDAFLDHEKEFLVFGLEPGQEYYWHVWAVDQHDNWSMAREAGDWSFFSTAPDTDGDGVIDELDNDDDNDGYLDVDDAFPLDATEWADFDQDGIGDNADLDDDNDGVNDDTDPFPYDPIDLNRGLVGYYPFNGNANDESGNGNDGYIYQALLTQDRFGNQNSAYYFDGSNDRIVINSSQLDLPTALTISGFIKLPRYTTSSRLSVIEKWSGSTGYPYAIRIDPDSGTLSINSYDRTNSFGASSTSALNDNTWHHFIAVRQGNTLVKMFIDGVLESEGNNGNLIVSNATNGAPVGFGYSADLNHRYFEGSLDDIRIYNRVLSKDEISALLIEDGFGDLDADGFSRNDGDYDDNDPSIYPGSIEIPYDGFDQDCDGYDLRDVDGDGYDGYQVGGPDLDDSNPDISPGSPEVCGDGIDNNCDGEIDEGCGLDLNYGLVAQYPFAGNANDVSGNGNDGIEYGEPNYEVGLLGQALNLDGADDSIELPNIYSDTQTFSLWFKKPQISQERMYCLFERMNPHSIDNFQGYRLRVNSVGKLNWQILSNDPDNTISLYTNERVDDNRWHHVVAVIERISTGLIEAYYYLDGVEIGSDTINVGTYNHEDHLCVGDDTAYSAEDHFEGNIDEFRIYNRALSETEIQELYSQGNDLEQGLVAHYPFDGNANDESGNGNDGIEDNGVTYTSGVMRQCASFDGIDDQIQVNDSSLLDITGPITLSSWVKTSGTVDHSGILCKVGATENDRNGYNLSIGSEYNGDETHAFRFNINYDWPSIGRSVYSGIPIEDNAWHHVIGIYDGEYANIYVDGNLLISVNYNGGILRNSHPLFIGYDPYAYADRHFKGQIDEIRIYNHALSEAEIQELYNEPYFIDSDKDGFGCSFDCDDSNPNVYPEAGNDTEKPEITLFQSQNSLIPEGNQCTAEYSATDDQGLVRVELWRKADLNGNGDPDDEWEVEPTQTELVSGMGATGTLVDENPPTGSVWYGIHVVDMACNVGNESLSGLEPLEIYVYNDTTDYDNDGMPDVWETEHGLNSSFSDASGDFDGDGYTNIEEYMANSLPNNALSVPGSSNIAVPALDSGAITVDGQISDWEGIPVAGSDYINDSAPGTDVKALYLATDGVYLYYAAEYVSNAPDISISHNLLLSPESAFDPPSDGDYETNITADSHRLHEFVDGSPLLVSQEDINGIDRAVEGRFLLSDVHYEAGDVTYVFFYPHGFTQGSVYDAIRNCKIVWPTMDVSVSCTDADGDGFFAEANCGTYVDCQDDNSEVYPGAEEVCGDNLDNSCDGQIDENCGNSVDSDGDGMPDEWESTYGLDPLIPDGVNDFDGDGYTNLEEYEAGTNPNNITSFPSMEAGLLAYYPFDGNANDESGQWNDGIEYGGVIYAGGMRGRAASFDGLDDYIFVPDAQSLRLSDSSFTISLWVYEIRQNKSNANALLTKRGKGHENGWFLMLGGETDTNPGKFTYYQSVGPDDPRLISSQVLDLNSWHHVLLRYEATTQVASLFVDGVLDREVDGFPSPNPDTINDLYIGKDSSENLIGGYFFAGKIDEIRVYNRALSEAEIQNLYRSRISSIVSMAKQTTIGIELEAYIDHFTNNELIDLVKINNYASIQAGWLETISVYSNEMTCSFGDILLRLNKDEDENAMLASALIHELTHYKDCHIASQISPYTLNIGDTEINAHANNYRYFFEAIELGHYTIQQYNSLNESIRSAMEICWLYKNGQRSRDEAIDSLLLGNRYDLEDLNSELSFICTPQY